MKEGKAKFEHKGLVILLCVLLVAIVGLGVGIGVILNNNHINEELVNNETGSVSALAVNERIMDRLDSDPEYTIDDAIEDFEKEMDNGDNAHRVDVAIYFADFVYTYHGDINESVAILSRVEDLLEDDEEAISYYATLRRLYESEGLDVEADFYNQKVIDLMYKDTRSIEELKGRETYEEELL